MDDNGPVRPPRAAGTWRAHDACAVERTRSGLSHIHALTGIVFIAAVEPIDRSAIDKRMNFRPRDAHVLQRVVAQPAKGAGGEVVLPAGPPGFAGHPDFPGQGPRSTGCWRSQGDG